MEQLNTQAMTERYEIELLPLLKALWRKAWLIFAVSLFCGSIAYAYARFGITPTYKTSFTAYVNNKSEASGTESLSNADLQASQDLVHTYAEIITSRTVLTEAAKRAGINCTFDELKKMVSTSTVSDTEIIEVVVIAENPDNALALAEQIAEIVPDSVSRIVEGSSLQMIDKPVFPDKRYSPSFPVYILLGLFAGAVISFVVVLAQEFLDNRIRSEKELQAKFGIPIVGSIPDLVAAQNDDNGYKYGYGYGKKAGREVKNNGIVF